MCTVSWQTQPALLGGVLKLASCPAIPQCGVSSAGRLHGPRVPPPFPRVDVRIELCLQPQHVLARERSPATVTRRLRPMAPAPAVEGRAGVAIAIAPVHQCVIHTRVASWPPPPPPPHAHTLNDAAMCIHLGHARRTALCTRGVIVFAGRVICSEGPYMMAIASSPPAPSVSGIADKWSVRADAQVRCQYRAVTSNARKCL